jgi:glyoxylase-like metal-dependent hydrolase (beta-lactamase superfamily II)
VLPYCGGITVIHTPGNVCLYLKKHKILIAGDIFAVNDGQLFPSKLSMNLDPAVQGKIK